MLFTQPGLLTLNHNICVILTVSSNVSDVFQGAKQGPLEPTDVLHCFSMAVFINLASRQYFELCSSSLFFKRSPITPAPAKHTGYAYVLQLLYFTKHIMTLGIVKRFVNV